LEISRGAFDQDDHNQRTAERQHEPPWIGCRSAEDHVVEQVLERPRAKCGRPNADTERNIRQRDLVPVRADVGTENAIELTNSLKDRDPPRESPKPRL
jgi:hypothetical protein